MDEQPQNFASLECHQDNVATQRFSVVRSVAPFAFVTNVTPMRYFVIPQNNKTWKTEQRLEAEYYERQRLKYDKEFQMRAKMRHELESIPMEKQCHRYRWRQTETAFDVEIPMLTACEDDQLWLVVEQDQLQVAVRNDDTFGAITVGGVLGRRLVKMRYY